MKTTVSWTEGMSFNGRIGDHVVHMDTKPPLGKDSGPSPKELVAMGLGGCTAMDVIALLKKYKQFPDAFWIDVEIQTSTGKHPAVFTKAILTYVVQGALDEEKLKDAVSMSQSMYCGVSAMLAMAFSIEYQIVLNGKVVGNGAANFKKESL